MSESYGGNLPDPAVPEYQFKTMAYFRQGWETLKGNLAGFLGFTVAAFLITFTLNSLHGLGSVISLVVGPPLWAGMIIVALKVQRQEPVQANDYLLGFRYIVPLVIYTVVSSIFFCVGLLLLVLPGIYLAVGYLFTTCLIVDQQLDFWPAMELSRRTIHQHWFEVFGFCLLLLLLNVAGALFIGVGLLVTIPWSICAITAAYQDVFRGGVSAAAATAGGVQQYP